MAGGPYLIVITGPTAVGKSAMAIRLAQALNTAVISADSRQFYRELTIGTAKPTRHELETVPHYLIDNLSVADDYNAARYADDALRILGRLFQDGRYGVLCGGSGLYIKALLEGFHAMPGIPADVREGVDFDYRHKGLAWLQAEVARVDPAYSATVDRLNPRRLMRALETYRSTGMRMQEFRKGEREVRPFEAIRIGLELPRELLYRRIEARVDRMVASGLLEETRAVIGYRDKPALQTVGYAEMFKYLDGGYTFDEAVQRIKQNTRRYAKRQLTWLRKDKEITWFHPNESESVIQFIRQRTE